MTESLPAPTDDTWQLVKVAFWILNQIYKPHHTYVKAGVMLGELVPITGVQQDLFASPTL